MVQEGLPVKRCCDVLGLSRSGYYAWLNRPEKLITEQELMLYRRAKALFNESRQSLGSRELAKRLCKEDFVIGREKTRQLMKKLKLVVKQRVPYKAAAKRGLMDSVAPNSVNMKFNPAAPNQVWAGDITYLKTGEGWMYLSIVMDLYSRRIIGWSIDSHMTTELVVRSVQQAYWLRKPPKGVIFHSDRGSQYTSQKLRNILEQLQITPSMGDVGACWDNAVVERFFGSLKHDWILKVRHSTREEMALDVAAYMRYYNLDRLHTTNGDMSPVDYENCKLNVSIKA